MALHPFLLFTNQGSRILSAKVKKHISSILIFAVGIGIVFLISCNLVNPSKKLSSSANTEQTKLLETLDSRDPPRVLKELLAQSEPNELSKDQTEIVKTILEKWAMENFDEAWKWAKAYDPEPTKIFLVGILLKKIAERDPYKTLALYYEMEHIGPNYESDVPEILLKASAKKGTEEFIDLLNKFEFANRSTMFFGTSRCTQVEFSPDFDFKRAANATVALIKKHANNNRPYPDCFPENFIYEWAKRDFNAADKWMSENSRLPFSEWYNLNDAAQEALGTRKAGIWMAAKLESSKYREQLLETLLGFSTAKNVKSVAAAMPDTNTRDKFLKDLVCANIGHYADNSTGTALSLMSTPAVRLAALRKIPSQNDWRPNDEELKSMGITRAQFNEINELNESKKTE